MDPEQLDERLGKAEGRVKRAEWIVAEQIKMIERLKDNGVDTTEETGLLRAFQELLVMHIGERDRVREQLAMLVKFEVSTPREG